MKLSSTVNGVELCTCMCSVHVHVLCSQTMVNMNEMLVKAITNSTYGHHGEMALPEMMVIGG